MSDEEQNWDDICPKCHNVLAKCTCRKIKIEVGRDQEIDSLHEDLVIARQQAEEGDQDRIEAEKGIIALEAFEKAKEIAVKLAPNLRGQIEKASSPQMLEDILAGITHQGPSGKASLERPVEGGGVSVDDIYTILKWPQRYSKEQVEDAELKRKTLMKSLFAGQSVQTMKDTKRTVYGDTNLTYCPECQRNKKLTTIDLLKDSECPYCHWIPNKEERSRRV